MVESDFDGIIAKYEIDLEAAKWISGLEKYKYLDRVVLAFENDNGLLGYAHHESNRVPPELKKLVCMEGKLYEARYDAKCKSMPEGKKPTPLELILDKVDGKYAKSLGHTRYQEMVSRTSNRPGKTRDEIFRAS